MSMVRSHAYAVKHEHQFCMSLYAQSKLSKCTLRAGIEELEAKILHVTRMMMTTIVTMIMMMTDGRGQDDPTPFQNPRRGDASCRWQQQD